MFMRVRRQFQNIEHVIGDSPGFPLAAQIGGRAEHCAPEPVIKAMILRRAKIFPHGQAVPKANVLKRARHPGGGDVMRTPSGNRPALKLNIALRRLIKAADHVEHRRFSRAVRPDQPD